MDRTKSGTIEKNIYSVRKPWIDLRVLPVEKNSYSVRTL